MEQLSSKDPQRENEDIQEIKIRRRISKDSRKIFPNTNVSKLFIFMD